jgi:hypothetical protein
LDDAIEPVPIPRAKQKRGGLFSGLMSKKKESFRPNDSQ